jgi:hypothetical protein
MIQHEDHANFSRWPDASGTRRLLSMSRFEPVTIIFAVLRRGRLFASERLPRGLSVGNPSVAVWIGMTRSPLESMDPPEGSVAWVEEPSKSFHVAAAWITAPGLKQACGGSSGPPAKAEWMRHTGPTGVVPLRGRVHGCSGLPIVEDDRVNSCSRCAGIPRRPSHGRLRHRER